MSTTYYDERRRDRAADREQDRADRLADREQDRVDRAAEREEARRLRAEQKREKARRRAERQKARAELVGKLGGEGDTVGALIAMTCGIVAALYFQLRALNGEGLPLFITVCLAVMLE
ncbi:hypothetical protein ACIQU6_41435 [Streptomyces sp. NPDC090442]|uniref:hypothetical protein n=1 Tax=Streptomyces sp. NPDC090442 TaxID=3365962 RepID=UPI00381039C3